MEEISQTVPRAFEHSARDVGVDVRSRSFGFIIFEEMAVLDCGTRECQGNDVRGCLRARFRRVLTTYTPSRVIVRQGRATIKGTYQNRSATLAVLKREAQRLSVPFVTVDDRSTRLYFRSLGARNKREVARILTDLCPELIWKLPPRRKPWQREDERLSIFDAASAVIAYTATPKDQSDPVRGDFNFRFDTREASS